MTYIVISAPSVIIIIAARNFPCYHIRKVTRSLPLFVVTSRFQNLKTLFTLSTCLCVSSLLLQCKSPEVAFSDQCMEEFKILLHKRTSKFQFMGDDHTTDYLIVAAHTF